jgi:putative membrane protein
MISMFFRETMKIEAKLTDPEPQTAIRDALAIERTIMSNERTMLAYSRTAIALIIAGLSFWNLHNQKC